MISHLCRLPIRQHDGENRENWKSATTGHCADHSAAKCCHWIVHIKLNNFLSFQVRWCRSRWAPLNVGFMKHLGGKSSLTPLHQIIPFCQNCNDEFTFRRLPIRPKWAAETVTNWIEMYIGERNHVLYQKNLTVNINWQDSRQSTDEILIWKTRRGRYSTQVKYLHQSFFVECYISL